MRSLLLVLLLLVLQPGAFAANCGDFFQNTDVPAELFLQAEVVAPILSQFTDDVSKVSGARAEPVSRKDRKKVEEKASQRKSGNYAQIFDYARAALVCEDMGMVERTLLAIRNLAAEREIEIMSIKDRFEIPKETGYRDIHVTLRIPFWSPDGRLSSHIVEIQIHIKELFEAKMSEGDAFYREILRLEKDSSAEAQGLLETKKEAHVLLFKTAWENYLKRKSSSEK